MSHCNPSPTWEYEISDHLKSFKEKLIKELKQHAQTHA